MHNAVNGHQFHFRTGYILLVNVVRTSPRRAGWHCGKDSIFLRGHFRAGRNSSRGAGRVFDSLNGDIARHHCCRGCQTFLCEHRLEALFFKIFS